MTPAVVSAVRAFATQRQADLWSGVGLAATFAGGCDDSGLRLLVREAGELAPHLAQGAVFAAKARDFSGYVGPHTAAALHALAGLSVRDAAVLADDVTAGRADESAEPDYQVWREQIRTRLAVSTASST